MSNFGILLLCLGLFQQCHSFVPLANGSINIPGIHFDASKNQHYQCKTRASNKSILYGKKANRKGGGGGGKKGGQQKPQEKKAVQEARFDAQTRQFMFTMVGLTKTLPDKSKTILKDIYLSFYPGAKIGVIGLNGSGKSTLMKIMAGVDTEFDGK